MKLLIIDHETLGFDLVRAWLDANGNTVLQPTDDVETLRAVTAALRARLEEIEPVPAAEIERRLGETSTALEIAHRDLAAFSYAISHDLRAPLRAISGFTEILMRDHASAIPSEAGQLFERVLANVKRMNEMIDALLEFSRIGSRPLEVVSIDMNCLVRECVPALSGLFTGKANVTVSELPACRADRAMLKRVLLNLLSNAFKYSDGCAARIEIGGEVRAGEFIYHVRDNGIGFDNRMADKLFEIFQRLHTQQQFQGAGVGLAIVRRIIQRHRGRVWAEGTPGCGATFYFCLPAGGARETVVP